MGQLTDIPYSVLKENERAYEVMLLRDLYDNTYSDIAKEYGVRPVNIVQLYHKAKIKQLRLYARHLAITHGHENTSAFSLNKIHDCYWDFKYVSAYFGKKYKGILTEYRAGEPGMPEQFIKTLPPLKIKLNAKSVDRLIKLREVDKKTFSAIGKELKLTEERAKREYDSFYHKKIMVLKDKIKDEIKEQTGESFWKFFDRLQSSKKQYDILIQNFPGLIDSEKPTL